MHGDAKAFEVDNDKGEGFEKLTRTESGLREDCVLERTNGGLRGSKSTAKLHCDTGGLLRWRDCRWNHDMTRDGIPDSERRRALFVATRLNPSAGDVCNTGRVDKPLGPRHSSDATATAPKGLEYGVNAGGSDELADARTLGSSFESGAEQGDEGETRWRNLQRV